MLWLIEIEIMQMLCNRLKARLQHTVSRELEAKQHEATKQRITMIPGACRTTADCCRWSDYIKRTVSRRCSIHRKSLNSITFVKKTLV
jgi:hypothetical protein